MRVLRGGVVMASKYGMSIFTVYSMEDFDIDEVTQHDFPGNIICFFTSIRDRGRH